MIVVSILPHAEFVPNDQRKDKLHSKLSKGLIPRDFFPLNRVSDSVSDARACGEFEYGFGLWKLIQRYILNIQ